MKNKAARQEVVADAASNLSQGKGAYMRHFGNRHLVGLVTALALSLLSNVFAQVLEDFDYINRYLNLDQGSEYLDHNGDGTADTIVYETNGDGLADAYRISSNYNGYYDTTLIIYADGFGSYDDRNQNAVLDYAFAFQAGKFFSREDPEEDGTWTSWVDLDTLIASIASQPQQTPSPSDPGPSSGIGAAIDMMETFKDDPAVVQQLQIYIDNFGDAASVWTAPNCTASYDGCR